MVVIIVGPALVRKKQKLSFVPEGMSYGIIEGKIGYFSEILDLTEEEEGDVKELLSNAGLGVSEYLCVVDDSPS